MSVGRGQVPCRHRLLKASVRTSARTAACGRRCVVDATVGSVYAALGAARHECMSSAVRPGADTNRAWRGGMTIGIATASTGHGNAPA
jgi:hypothetical protein